MYSSIWSGACIQPNAMQMRPCVANRLLGTLFGEVVCTAHAKWSPVPKLIPVCLPQNLGCLLMRKHTQKTAVGFLCRENSGDL